MNNIGIPDLLVLIAAVLTIIDMIRPARFLLHIAVLLICLAFVWGSL